MNATESLPDVSVSFTPLYLFTQMIDGLLFGLEVVEEDGAFL